MRIELVSAFALAALLAGPAFAVKEGPPIAPGDNQLLPAVQKAGMEGMSGEIRSAGRPPNPNRSTSVPPPDPDRQSSQAYPPDPGRAPGENKLLPAVQTPDAVSTQGIIGPSDANLPAVQAPSPGTSASQNPGPPTSPGGLVEIKPGPPSSPGGLVGMQPGPPQIGGNSLPAVQTPGMTGMDGMEGMGGANLPAIQVPNIGGDANLLPAVQLPAGGMPGGMGPAGFKH